MAKTFLRLEKSKSNKGPYLHNGANEELKSRILNPGGTRAAQATPVDSLKYVGIQWGTCQTAIWVGNARGRGKGG